MKKIDAIVPIALKQDKGIFKTRELSSEVSPGI